MIVLAAHKNWARVVRELAEGEDQHAAKIGQQPADH